METLQISKDAVEKAKAYAQEEGMESVEKVLDMLFPDVKALNGDGGCSIKPTLDDYKTIKTYEDACKALDEKPWLNMNPNMCYDENLTTEYDDIPKHIVALMKLETISRALWGKNFEPKPDAEGSKIYWYPWFALYTQADIDRMDEEDKGDLLSAHAGDGASAGFGCLVAFYRSSTATARIGFRLCQETEEKARYFGKQFIYLWAEYLSYNFNVQPKND